MLVGTDFNTFIICDDIHLYVYKISNVTCMKKNGWGVEFYVLCVYNFLFSFLIIFQVIQYGCICKSEKKEIKHCIFSISIQFTWVVPIILS